MMEGEMFTVVCLPVCLGWEKVYNDAGLLGV